MNPFLRGNSNMLLFSECNKNIIDRTVEHHTDCLTVSPCHFGGACCNKGKLLSRGTICRSYAKDEPCMSLGFCNGLTADCPASSRRSDNTLCYSPDRVPGVCHTGRCIGVNAEFCSERGQISCTLPGNPCARACQDRVDQSTCQLVAGHSLFPGTPCTLTTATGVSTGVCTTDQRCRTSTSGDPVALQIPSPTCGWHANDWSACSTDCDGGIRQRTFECACDDGSKDTSGRWCNSSQPPPESEPCNKRRCSSCHLLSVSAPGTSIHGAKFRRKNGDGMEGSDCQTCHHYFDERSQQFLFQLQHHGRLWWAIGPHANTESFWVYYTRSTSNLPVKSMGVWFHRASSKKADRESSVTTVPTMRLICGCGDGERLSGDGAGCEPSTISTAVTSSTR